MIKRLFASCLLFLAFGAAHAGSSAVFLSDTTKLFYGLNNEIYTPDGKKLLYFQKGNIFFSGGTDDRQNIYLMVTSLNIASEKLEMIYEKDSRQPSFSFSDNKFYSGNIQSEDFREKAELIHVERMKKWLAFYSSYNDSLIAYYNADSLPASAAILVAYTLIKRFDLESRMVVQQNKLPFEENPNGYATLRPMWGNATANEWMWDGTVLRPRWNVDPNLAWTFDGKTIKPQYGSNIYLQYEWDGENFRPVWRSNRAMEWSWDGRIMKPIYDTDWANQYVIEAGVVKPWSNVHTEKEWRMEGDIPVPLIILIISGIARPF